jgi:outer membrane protein insertion porin family
LESNEYSNISSSVDNSEIREGRTDTSSLSPSLVYDTRDNIFNPTRGTQQKLAVEFAGGPLGGDNNFLKYNFDSSYYLPVIWQIVFAVHGGIGFVHGFEYGVNGYTQVPVNERFRLGGTDSVRGYREGNNFGKDLEGDAGHLKLVSNIELHFPIVGPLRGVTFFDAGNVWNRYSELADFPHLYKGAGVGFRLTIPGTVMLIRFDFGFPLDRAAGEDAPVEFHFNIGNIF